MTIEITWVDAILIGIGWCFGTAIGELILGFMRAWWTYRKLKRKSNP